MGSGSAHWKKACSPVQGWGAVQMIVFRRGFCSNNVDSKMFYEWMHTQRQSKDERNIRNWKGSGQNQKAGLAFYGGNQGVNLPNVMLESLACGTPVIGFPIGGVTETIKNGFNGLLCDEVSVDALGRTISRFFSSDGFDANEIREDSTRRFGLAVQAQRRSSQNSDERWPRWLPIWLHAFHL
jgi:hypothetical protein